MTGKSSWAVVALAAALTGWCDELPQEFTAPEITTDRGWYAAEQYDAAFAPPPGPDWQRSLFSRLETFDGKPETARTQPPVPELVGNEMTWDVWFRPQRWPSVFGTWWEDQGLRQKTLFNKSWSWQMTIMASGELRFTVFGADNQSASVFSDQLIEPGLWYHAVAVFSYSGQRLELYLNGRLAGSSPASCPAMRNTPDGVLWIGSDEGNANLFEGELADWKIIPSALSREEAQVASDRLPGGESARTQVEAEYRRKWPSSGPAGDAIIPFVTDPVSTRMLLPWSLPSEDLVGNKVVIRLTPGEYEPASCVVYPLCNEDQVKARIEPLRCGDAELAADSIDIRLVKCWFQENTAWRMPFTFERNVKILTPELLVHDDRLVDIDLKNRRNLLRLNFPNREERVDVTDNKYLCTPDPTRPGGVAAVERWTFNLSFTDFPVHDAATLQPFELKAGQLQQLWLTVHAPADQAPGVYRGKLVLENATGRIGEFVLEVEVLPFQLAEPRTYYNPDQPFEVSIFSSSILDLDSPGNYSLMHRSPATYLAELNNMKQHNITNPLLYQLQTNPDEATFREALKLRTEAGFANQPLYLSGPEANLGIPAPSSEAELTELRRRAEHILDMVERITGHRDVYVYGVDEAIGERLHRQLEAWKLFHEMGLNIMVATYGGGKDDILNTPLAEYLTIPVTGHLIDRKISARWHERGAKIWNYGWPQSGPEDPEFFRRAYGFAIHRANYDGIAPFCFTETFGNPWNDFDNLSNRDHNLVYPTADGFVDTLAWEGFREGIDDIKYATTLLLAIRTAENSGDPQQRKLAQEAAQWLETVNLPQQSLSSVRNKIIDYLKELHSK